MTSYRFAPNLEAGRIENNKKQPEGVEFTLPLRALHRSDKPSIPSALVASSDENALQKIADIVFQCGLSAYLASTVESSKRILERGMVSLAVCDDRLTDGNYEDILGQAARLQPETPVIVVSSTGDWPDYLKAINAGAFDFLAYPPIQGEFQRTIREALTTQRQTFSKEEKHVFA